jgi:hypothetical protein
MVRLNEIRHGELAARPMLIDLGPDRALFTPIAPRQAGDDQTEQAS